MYAENVDRELGNKEGFTEGFDFKTPERGVATHVYAAFEPSLKGTCCTVLVVSGGSRKDKGHPARSYSQSHSHCRFHRGYLHYLV